MSQISRREFESEMQGLRAEIRHVHELHEQRAELLAEQLVLQATEISRRLDDLNHERAREKEERARTLSSEKWEEWRAGYESWREEVTSFIANQQGRLAVWALLYGVALLAVSVVLTRALR